MFFGVFFRRERGGERDDFALKEHLAMSRDLSVVMTQVCYWNPLSRGQVQRPTGPRTAPQQRAVSCKGQQH